MAKRPDRQTLSELVARIEAASLSAENPPKERREIVRLFAGERKISERTAWRWAKLGGWDSGRKERADKGRSAIDEETVRRAAKLTYNSAKGKGERFLRPAWLCLKDLERNELMEKGLAAATLSRRMREAELSPEQMAEARDRPRHVRMMSAGPNEMHQIDATHCVKFFATPKGLLFRDLKKTVYHNKPDKVLAVYSEPARIWRYAVIDHYSGSFSVIYREEPGESAAGYLEAMIAAWGRDDDPTEQCAFHGVPRMLVADRGSAILAEKAPLRRLLKTLGVEARAHSVGNPRAKGSVESLMRHWEQWFESGLAADPAKDVEELNRRAARLALYINRVRPFRRLGAARRDLSRERRWLAIRQDALRELPADLDMLRFLLTYEPQTRVVGRDGYISFALAGSFGQKYSGVWKVSDSTIWGKKVLVHISPYRLEERREIEVEADTAFRPNSSAAGRRYLAAEVRVNAAGFPLDATPWGEYRRPAEGKTERELKRALATDEPKDFRSFTGEEENEPFARRAIAIPRRGAEIEIEAPERRVGIVAAQRAALRMVEEEYGAGSASLAEKAALAARWEGAESVTEDEVEAAAGEIIARLASREPEDERRKA